MGESVATADLPRFAGTELARLPEAGLPLSDRALSRGLESIRLAHTIFSKAAASSLHVLPLHLRAVDNGHQLSFTSDRRASLITQSGRVNRGVIPLPHSLRLEPFCDAFSWPLSGLGTLKSRQ